MSALRLNRPLTLEAPTRTSDGAGGFVEAWTALGVHWADVSARAGREGGSGGAALSAVSYLITVRAAPVGSSARPCPDQRFRDGIRVFHIEAVAENGADARYLRCFAKEEVVA